MMTISRLDVPYPMVVKPTLSQRLRMFIARGAVKAFTDNEHFAKPTLIYIFKCPEGKWILDYLHGSPPNQYLNCPSTLGIVTDCKGCAEAHRKQEQSN